MLLLADTVRVAVAVPPCKDTGVTLNDAPIPVEEAAAVRLTEQQNPLTLARVIVVVDEDPTWTVRLAGLALMVKSTTLTSMVME